MVEITCSRFKYPPENRMRNAMLERRTGTNGILVPQHYLCNCNGYDKAYDYKYEISSKTFWFNLLHFDNAREGNG